MKKQLNKSKATSTPVLLILYAFLAEIIFFTASCIIALILDIKHENYYIFSITALALGSFASGFVSTRKIRRKGMLNGIIYALPSNLIFTFISVILNSFSIDYNIIFTFILVVVSSAAGGITSVNIRSRKIITPKHARK